MTKTITHKASRFEAIVSGPSVGIDRRTKPNVVQGGFVQCLTLHIGDDLSANLARSAIQHTEHSGLLCMAIHTKLEFQATASQRV